MSVPKRPYTYSPDDAFDFGFAGEHFVTFVAWIESPDPGFDAPVYITRMYATVTSDGHHQEWDLTWLLKKYPLRAERYESEIRADWLKAKQKDWDETA